MVQLIYIKESTSSMGSIWEKPFFTGELSLGWWNSPSERKVPLSSATYIYINCATSQCSTVTYILFHSKYNSILRFMNWNYRIWTHQTGTLQGGLASADGDSRKWKWFQYIFLCLLPFAHRGLSSFSDYLMSLSGSGEKNYCKLLAGGKTESKPIILKTTRNFFSFQSFKLKDYF